MTGEATGPIGAPDYRHPSWCDFTRCTADDVMAKRDDANTVPWYDHDHHISTRVVVAMGQFGPTFELALRQYTFEPVETADTSVVLTVRRADLHSVEGYEMADTEHVRALAAVLNDHADQMDRRSAPIEGDSK